MASKRGRTRKQGQRHKGGKLVQPERQERESEAMAVASRHQLKDVLEVVKNPHFGSALGRALLFGVINEQQREAGYLFEITVRKYARIMGIPLAPKVTQNLNKIPGAPLDAEPDDKEIAKARADYDNAFEALSTAGRRALMEAKRVCLDNEPVSEGYALQQATQALVELWDIQPGEPQSSKEAIRIRKHVSPGYKPVENQATEKQRKRSA